MEESRSKKLKGKVVSSAMQKTVIVAVDRYVKHAKYRKCMRVTKRFKAHDENNEYAVGDRVIIRETRPISKDKHFKVIGKV